jgi:SnoaL-like domain
MKLPKAIEIYIKAVNADDHDTFESSFAPDAVVKDVGREIRGIVAIRQWADQEIFAVNVPLDVMDVDKRDGQTIITVKIDGTFDHTGLPDPLLMDHFFIPAADKISVLTCRLAAKADIASRTRCRKETSHVLQHIELADPQSSRRLR